LNIIEKRQNSLEVEKRRNSALDRSRRGAERTQTAPSRTLEKHPDENIDGILSLLHAEGNSGDKFEFTDHIINMTKPNYYLRNLNLDATHKDPSRVKKLMH
jgi:hypothetical protein